MASSDSRDVINAILTKGGSPARVGLRDAPWSDTVKKWATQGYPTNAKGKPADVPDHFDYDMVESGGWFDVLPIRGYSEVVEETDNWKVVRNGAGACLKWWKSKSGTPEHISFEMTSRDIWQQKYRPHLLELDTQRVTPDKDAKELARRREQGYWVSYGHLFIWENMRQSLGDVCLYESMALDPEWIHDYNRVYTDFFKAHYEHLFTAGLPDGIWVYEDLGYKGSLFCSPDMYERMIFPYYRELVDFFHERGLPVILHTCGLVEPILDRIVEIGFDGLHPMEVKAGNDPLRIAESHGDRIRRETAALIDGMKSAGARYIFCSDHSISSSVDYDDYRTAVETYHQHKDY